MHIDGREPRQGCGGFFAERQRLTSSDVVTRTNLQNLKECLGYHRITFIFEVRETYGLGLGDNGTANDSNARSFLSGANPLSGWRGPSPGAIGFQAQEDEL